MDHYSVLGVKPNATKPQIKEAFKKLAMEFHPDKHTGSSKSAQNYATFKFQQVSEAYEVLTNDSKRADFDSRCGYGRSRTRGGFSSTSTSSYCGGGSGYGHGNESGDFDAFKDMCRNRYRHSAGGGLGLDAVVRFLSSPVVLISIAFASTMVATTSIFDNRRDRLSKTPNCGKSHDEAMDMEWRRRANLQQHYRARCGSNHAHHYYYSCPPRCDE